METSKEKEMFLEKVSDGVWFQNTNRYGQTYLVKIKSVWIDGAGSFLDMLWLSKEDPESMCFEEVQWDNWRLDGNKLFIDGAGVYHFGSTDGDANGLIYDDDFRLNEEKMKRIVMSYAKSDFLTLDELEFAWSMLKSGTITYETLEFPS